MADDTSNMSQVDAEGMTRVLLTPRGASLGSCTLYPLCLFPVLTSLCIRSLEQILVLSMALCWS